MSAAIWTALYLALETRAAVGVTSELRGGRAPLTAGLTSVPTVAWTTSPSLSLLAFDETRSFRLSYAPRLLLRAPNIEGRLRPIIFHQAALEGSQRFSPTVAASLNGTGGVGELDYSAWQQLLGNVGANVPRTNRLAQASAAARLSVKASPNVAVENDLRASIYWPLSTTSMAPEPMDSMSTLPTLFLARQLRIEVGPRVTKRLSVRDAVSAGVDTAYYHSNRGLRLLAINPQVGVERLLDRVGMLRVTVGITVVRDLAPAEALVQSESRVAPSFELLLTNQITAQRGFALNSDLGITTGYTVDPVLGRGRVRGLATWRLRAAFTRQWSAAFEVGFGTSLMNNPLVLGPTSGVVPPADPAMAAPPGTYPYETQLIAVLPVRYQHSADFAFEAGARFVERGPHLRAPNFALGDRETWLYVLATAGFDFSRRRPATTISP